MTIGANDRRTRVEGNGSTTEFSYDFPIVEDTELHVYLIDANGDETRQTLNTHFTVTTKTATGGKYTMVTAPAATESLVAHGVTPAEQSYDPTSTQTYSPGALMAAIDRLMKICQENRRDLDYVLKYKIGTDNYGLTGAGGVPDPDTAGDRLESETATNPPTYSWEAS